jgi:pimeloyl-ACP methyl ester carboxylesterase
MQMEFVESMGFQIAYQVKNPDLKNTIFFVHGNSGSTRFWEKQFNNALFSAYRLIAFDLPAHEIFRILIWERSREGRK